MLRTIKTLLLTIVLTIPLVGSVQASCPVGDLNGDCQVDWQDLQDFTEQWLDPPGCSGLGCADFDGQNGINFVDFAIMAENWLVVGEITGSLHVVIQPQKAIDLGAKWRIDSDVWRDSGEIVELPVGSYTVEFSEIGNQWIKPASQNVEVEEYLTTDITGTYRYSVVINEFMASNSSGSDINDPQGDYDDWIEIYNAGDTAINIAGMYLTNDLDTPTMWQVPGGNSSLTTILSHGYLLIWADEDVMDAGLHANFKLDADSGEIGLFNTDGQTLLDSVRFEKQTTNVSYGRSTDANDIWQFMGNPTPGSQNSGGYLGVVADVKFSHNRGFYGASFSVVIATDTNGASIYYTVDGSAPFDVTNGVPAPGATKYTAPIAITTTKCLRAVGFKTTWKPTNMEAQTYIFPAHVIVQSQQQALNAGYPSTWSGYPADYEMDPEIYTNPDYNGLMEEALLSIPTMSIATDKKNLFDPSTGIYTNPLQSGPNWERPTSVELFDPNGSKEFQINCGLCLQGGASREPYKAPKHSFSLRFRGTYGSPTLNFPLFDGSPVESFNSVHLRAKYNNSWIHNNWDYPQRPRAQYIRDQWIRDSFLDMGEIAAGRGNYVHLYLNGMYWGLYNLCERQDASHYAAYYGGDKDRLDAIKGTEVIDGNLTAWNEMKSIVAGRNWEQIQQVLDVDNYIDWTIINRFGGNQDLKAEDNWRAAGGGPDRRLWKLYSWDAERVLEDVNNTNLPSSVPDPPGLFSSLNGIDEFRIRFADRLHKHFFNGGALTPDKTIPRWTKWADELDLAIIGESARWGDYRRDVHQSQNGPYYLYTRNNHWLVEKSRLLNTYFPVRSDKVLQRYKTDGLYPSVVAPVFRINGSYKHGGYILPTDLLSMTAPAGTIYYTIDGNDPRLPGTRILAAGIAAKRVKVPTAAISNNWRGGGSFDDSGWTLVTGSPGGIGYDRDTGSGGNYIPYISYNVESLMYGTGKNPTCYIRIPFTVNAGDLSGLTSMTLKMRYDDGFVAYINGTEVYRKYFTGTPLWNSVANTDRTTDCSSPESFDISGYINTLQVGSNILAIHGLNRSVTNNDFLITAELVVTTSNDVSPTAAPYTAPMTLARSTHVKARVKSGSVWSALNEATYAVGPIAENMRITEIMYHPQDTNDPNDPNEEFIELKNIGAQALNLNLVKFTKGISFTFPDVNLAVSQYIVVVKDLSAFYERYPGFSGLVAGQYTGSLYNAGEKIRLEDAIGQVIHEFSYKDGWYDITDGMGFSLTIRDPNSDDPHSWDSKIGWRTSAYIGGSPGWDDSGEMPDGGTIVINELLAHSNVAPNDWIELHNTTDELINIGGWFLSDNDANYQKYEIAEGTTIDAYGYIVFYEDPNFGDTNDPGCHKSFALSENGETVYLHAGRNGQLMGFMDEEEFDASEVDIAFGRYLKSTGTYNFVAMSENTPGLPNAYPKVGPIVINEIMYHPDPNVADKDAEYVELLNISGSAVTLQEYDNEQHIYVPWRFNDSGGITFDFPLGTTMANGERLLIVKNKSIFDSYYPGVPGGVKIFEWGAGSMDNAGEKIELSKPGDQVLGIRYYIRVDRVNYSDGSHPPGEDPWPTAADGGGKSLGSLFPQYYGNDPNNWKAGTPSPGLANP